MRRLGITVLTSIDSVLRESTAFATLADVPRVVVVRHDLSQSQSSGLMRRVVSDASGVVEDTTSKLEHACLSCALREDLLRTLLRLAETRRWDDALLALPVAGEPLPVLRVLVAGTSAGRSVANRLRHERRRRDRGRTDVRGRPLRRRPIDRAWVVHCSDVRRALSEVLGPRSGRSTLSSYTGPLIGVVFAGLVLCGRVGWVRAGWGPAVVPGGRIPRVLEIVGAGVGGQPKVARIRW